MIDLKDISANLEQRADGLWHARSSSAICYPEWGNQACFQLENSSFWFQHRNDCILEAMKQFPPQGTVFDIGGGNGFVAKSMQDAGLEVVLIEPGLSGAKNAQSRGIRSIVCSTLQDAQFLPSSMSAVGLFDVVEHVDKEGAFMRLVRDHLVSRGRAYLTVPAYNFLWSQEDIEAGHQRRYSPERNSGFNAAVRIFGGLPHGFLSVPYSRNLCPTGLAIPAWARAVSHGT